MKIYIRITSVKELRDLETFLSDKAIKLMGSLDLDASSIVCALDNTSKTLTQMGPGELHVAHIPPSFILDWDPIHICNLYENKIIGRFNEGKPQWTLMDSKSMEPMIQVLMYGAKKYDRDNWKKACPKRLDLMDSLERHSMKIISGEAVDPESGLPHIGHLMCNAMFYSYWEQKTNGQFENYVPEIN